MTLLTQFKTATATAGITYPSNNVEYATTALQILLTASNFLDTSSNAANSVSAEKKTSSFSVGDGTAMLLLYVPSIIFLVNYLMPYFNAHKAGELTGTIFKMDSLKKNLVKNGRECLIGAMLLFHFAKKVFEFFVFHTHTSLPHTNGFSGLMKGVHQLAFCFIITTFSGSVLASKFTEEALNVGLAAFGVGEAGNFFHHLFSSSGKNSNSKKVDKSLPSSTSSSHPVVIKDVHSLWKKMKGKIPEVKKALDKLTNHPAVPVKLHDALTPNYLFELITWFGIACLSQHWNVYLVLTAVIAKAVVKAKSSSSSS